MSDALCGPSNALQNFQKHASVDRTLQQDRIVSRSSPSQGFRSPNPHEGVLDPEFAAFESNIPGAPLPELRHAAPFTAQGPHFMHPAENQSWAADFQKLQISGPSHPIHQQPGLSASSAPMMAQQGWQNEFMNQQQPQQRHTPNQQHQPYTQGFQSSFAPSYPMHASPMNAFPAAQEAIANQHPQTETFDESAFEAAFEQARADMASQAAEITQEHTEETTVEATHIETTTSFEPQETVRIGSDTIPQSNKEDPQSRVNDADELARTAGQLLDSVSHDQSQKFRESNFLALMRRIRDREVHVEGDEFRETSQSLHPGGKYYPGGQRAQEKQTNHDTTTHNFDGNSTVPDERNPTPFTGSTADDDTLYAAWNHGDSWA
ncbi:conserved hypothetical protein [Aspergillus terreus NIH2624]|uniref:Peroxin 20 n=1 Tax=Aspergillus terreus (strain NIH 2624 / FGSC A1156) TaxID=341663 RepID=Q0CHM1_ASPTN|nr:uncharacterized protein ATEG_06813 [Aspergillus terreus NIH2624]EAU33357.1 conserved hypothetical protein [Aspergillus terreus NIH2624]